jgi:hypothetical protein
MAIYYLTINLYLLKNMSIHYFNIIITACYAASSPRWCLYFDVVVGLVWSNDPESYAGGSIATGRTTHARQVEGDDPD